MKYILIILLIILSVVVVIPPLYYDYIYPTAGDDTASHLGYFQNMDSIHPAYFGQYLVGRFVNALPFDPKVTFQWFHFAVLIVALWVVGIAVGLAMNWLAGILSVLSVFSMSSLISLFQWGQIFDIVSIAILLPITLLCLHNNEKGLGWKIGVIVGIFVFMVFHTNGKIVYALVPMMVLYELAIVYLPKKFDLLGYRMKKYRFVYYAGGLSVILLILYKISFALSGDPGRLWMDGSILASLGFSGIIGLYLSRKDIRLALGVILLFIGLAIPNVLMWTQNNSAIKDVDKDAIAYLNSLDGRTYTASPEVAQWIYGLFVNKEFHDVIGEFHDVIGADYVVVRTTPMTPRSAVGNMYFQSQVRDSISNKIGDNGYKLIAVFNKGEKDRVTKEPIIVYIYTR